MRHAPAALVLALVLALVALAPGLARADGASFIYQFSIGTGGTTGGIGEQMDAMDLPILNMGVGFRTRRVGLLVGGDFMGFEPRDMALDGKELISFAGGVEIAGYHPLGGGWELYGRGGRKWRWLGGSGEVMRTCNQTGTCDGGFWPEEPDYASSGLTGAIGMQRTFSEKNLAAAVGLELRVEQVAMHLPGRGTVGGTLVFVGLNVVVGTAGYRR